MLFRLIKYYSCVGIISPVCPLRSGEPVGVSPPPRAPVSGSHSNGHLQKHTGTHGAHTDRQTNHLPACRTPTPRRAARLSAADQNQINRYGDRSALMSAAADQNRRVACGWIRGTGEANDDISV